MGRRREGQSAQPGRHDAVDVAGTTAMATGTLDSATVVAVVAPGAITETLRPTALAVYSVPAAGVWAGARASADGRCPTVTVVLLPSAAIRRIVLPSSWPTK